MNDDYALLQQELESTWAYATSLQEKLQEKLQKMEDQKWEIARLRNQIGHLEASLQAWKDGYAMRAKFSTMWREKYEAERKDNERLSENLGNAMRLLSKRTMTKRAMTKNGQPDQTFYWCSICGEVTGFCRCDAPHLYPIH